VKILVVSNFYPPDGIGGYELGCAQMVDALRGRGHDVRVLTGTSSVADDLSHDHVRRTLSVPPIYSQAQMDALGHDVLTYLHALARTVSEPNVKTLAAELLEFEPDVVYLWNILGLGGFGVLGLLAHQGIPWVWHLEDRVPAELCFFAEHRTELARVFGTFFPGSYIGCSGHVIGETRAYGIDLGEDVRVIPNWIVGDPRPVRREVYSGGELRILFAAGTLTEAKGTRVLIEAAAQLRSSGLANFTIDMYGREAGPEWRELILALDLADRIRLKGLRSHAEMLALYDDYDVFAFPTWSREPFGFVALEAAAAGCLPVVTADSGIAEWLIDGVDCLAAPRNAGAFAHRFAEILRGEVDFAGIVARGQASAWHYFHIDRAVGQVEAVLDAARADVRLPRGSLAQFFTLARFAEGMAQTLVLESR
jgi:glycogen(starch) synthase